MTKDIINNFQLEEKAFDIDAIRAYEGLMAQGNGYMHLRACHEENVAGYDSSREYVRIPANVTAEKFIPSACKYGFYIPGIYGQHPLLGQELVNLPYFLGLELLVDGEKLSLGNSNISQYYRCLNMRNAVLARKFTWCARNGAQIELHYERFISASDKHLALQKMQISSDKDIEIELISYINADVRTNGYDHHKQVMLSSDSDGTIRCLVETDEDQVEMLSRTYCPENNFSQIGSDRNSGIATVLRLEANKTISIEKHTAIKTSKDPKDIDLAEILQNSRQSGYDCKLKEHSVIWNNWWNKSDVVIESQDQSQLAIRTSVYHMLRCKVRDNISIDAKGYAGDAYFGRFFWDTEVFIMPFYLYTFPQAARQLLDFRVDTLGGARENARDYGYKGAKYAWESSLSGKEQCACWQYADHEIHIGADIVYAFEQYANAVDSDYFKGKVSEAIVEIARYYISRMDYRQGEDFPSLLGVMGPDEYTPISHNNAYTNWLVRHALALAARVGRDIGVETEELKKFASISQKLHIPRKGELILQCEDFDKLAEPDFDKNWSDKNQIFARCVSQERLYRSKCLKQADVLMLMFMFAKAFSDEEVKAAWDYYLPYTTHDSSLSAAVHAFIALRLGMKKDAMDFWEKSISIDMDIDARGSAEGVHIASCGMNWQLVVFGFAGIDRNEPKGVLDIKPALPEQWQRLSFPLMWHGNHTYIDISKNKTIVKNSGSQVLKVRVGNLVKLLQPQQEISISNNAVDAANALVS